ncbi:GNAT family N-acetyltransferase [Treponema berlinense]|uniref:GNAT family N-acetyltransferase n=1 Tax=Treponema berlinense TaxID=225004 RepID=UPI0026F1EC74|nr:GNAT family N-acetyltransferase [Treponema berlinense]
MIFRKAVDSDAGRCLEIYDAISDWEATMGKQCCWEKEFYPTMETVKSGLSAGELYVLEDEAGQVVSCGIINHSQPEFYKLFDWAFEADFSEVLVLHTFGVEPAMQKKGYGKTFMSFYEKMAYDAGCKTLRLDTVISNKKSQALYKKLGFTTTGQWEGDPNQTDRPLTFIGLEKILPPEK